MYKTTFKYLNDLTGMGLTGATTARIRKHLGEFMHINSNSSAFEQMAMTPSMEYLADVLSRREYILEIIKTNPKYTVETKDGLIRNEAIIQENAMFLIHEKQGYHAHAELRDEAYKRLIAVCLK